MAIRRQNRALFFIFALIVIVLALVLRREKKVKEYFEENPTGEEIEISQSLTASNPSITEPTHSSKLGPPIPSIEAPSLSSERQKAFVQVFEDMTSCLRIKSASYSERDPVEIEVLISQLQSELGYPNFSSDLWMIWNLRTSDGKEKRIRLEISSASDEPTIRELRYFNVDRDGVAKPVELDEQKAMNPSGETLNQMLREGDVFYKERAGFYVFPNGERLEYLEKNGQLSEIEMLRGESIFKCTDISAREKCRCLK